MKKLLIIGLLTMGSISANAMDIISLTGYVTVSKCSLVNGNYRGWVQFGTQANPRTVYKIAAVKRSYDTYDFCQVLRKAYTGGQDDTTTQLFISCEGYSCRDARVVGAVVSQPKLSSVAMFKLP